MLDISFKTLKKKSNMLFKQQELVQNIEIAREYPNIFTILHDMIELCWESLTICKQMIRVLYQDTIIHLPYQKFLELIVKE